MITRMLARDLLEALLPQQCVVCRRFGAALHDSCVDTLPAAAPPRCTVCWAPTRRGRCRDCAGNLRGFDALRAPFQFRGAARRALLEAKFRGVTALLEPLAVAAAALVPETWEVDAIVPVPLHPARRRRRGFNQASLIGHAIGRALSVPVLEGALRRTRQTEAQSGLTASERRPNVARAFEAVGAAPSRALLVDDVVTTGATLEAAARALRAAGAQRVFAVAIARED